MYADTPGPGRVQGVWVTAAAGPNPLEDRWQQRTRRRGVMKAPTPVSREFLAQLRAFRGAVEAHAEEAEVLPHAHRFAPESATGNPLLGPGVALVDRVRDILATTSPRAGS